MPRYKKQNSCFDMDKGHAYAAIILFGLLKGQISKEESERLYKETGIFDAVGQGSPEVVAKEFGKEYDQLAKDSMDGDDHDITSDEIYNSRVSEMPPKYYSSVWDNTVKRFKNAYREIADIMKEKADKIKFPNEAVRGYYDTVQQMAEDMAGDGWLQRAQNDPMYEYAFNLMIKMNLTAAAIDVRENGVGVTVVQADDLGNLAKFTESGILDSITGAMRVSRKMEACLKDRSVTRDELLDEMIMQKERMEKALSISKDDFRKLEFAEVTQNDYTEFTTGPRAFGTNLSNLSAKIDLLKAGWPVADIEVMASGKVTLDNIKKQHDLRNKPYLKEKKQYDEAWEAYNAMPADTDEQKKAKETRLGELTKWADNLKKSEEEIKKYKTHYDIINEQWTRSIAGPIDETVRSTCLGYMSVFVGAAAKELKGISPASYYAKRLQDRVQVKLTPAEKATLTSDNKGLYKALCDVDPALMSSSKQFSNLKKALKTLSEMKIDMNDQESIEDYTDQVKETARLATEYLRYKKYQAEGPEGAKHSRSDTEKQRVATVDNILNSLKTFLVPGTENEHIIDYNDPEYGVLRVDPGKRLLGEYTKTAPKNEYDKYMQAHTGVGVLNGTKEQLVDNLSKVMGAHIWKKHRPAVPFDEKKVEAFAKQAREELGLDTMSDNDLRRAVVTPDSVGKVIDHQNKKIYGLTEPKLTNGKLNDASYSQYISEMQTIYKNMIEPEEGNAAYKKIYESVKKIAHLPESLEGVNFDKVNTVIANANHDIMVGGYKYFKASGVGKKMVPPDSYVFTAMNVVSEECTETSGFLTEARNTVNRRRGVKEVTKGNFDITNPKCIDIEKYTTNRIRKLVRKNQNGQYRRQLDPELAKEYAKNVRQTIEDTQKNMAKDKNTALAAGKSKEAPVKGSRKSI